MSVYAGEQPKFLAVALGSIEAQSVLPDEIILIKDGPLGIALEQVIAGYASRLGIRSVQLQKNMGLAIALNAGLEKANHPWIMRFDSDDFCCPERVSRQRDLINEGNYDLFGAQIQEFDQFPADSTRSRRVPTLHEDIVVFCKKRNPFNHMTVCYRRELALRCGGYPEIRFMEDYGLWIKMLSVGARTANSHDVLVKARIGSGMIQRRGGLGYVKSEVRIQALMVRMGSKSVVEALRDGVLRSCIFLMPTSFRNEIYRRFLRENRQSHNW